MLPSSAEIDIVRVKKGGLFKFFQLAWPHVLGNVPLSTNWHHEIMCRGFEGVLRNDPISEKGVVNIPPGSTKSLLTSVFWPAYAWGPGKRPDWRVLFGSFDIQLSLRDSAFCKDLVSSPWYQERWGFKADPGLLKHHGLVPVCRGKEDSTLSDSASVWWTSGGGLRFATSTGSKATGWHFHCAVVDDPTKPKTIEKGGEEARTALRGTSDWWRQTIGTRRVDPNYYARWVIMQRLHTEDLAGECLKNGYTGIVVPAEHERARPCTTPWGNDPRTEDGESFWPERFGEKGLADLKKDLRSHSNAQLQQNPIPDGGNTFLVAWMQNTYRVLPAGMDRWWQSWDMAFSGKDNADYTVGQVWASKGANFYLVDQVRARMNLPEVIKAMERLTNRYPKAVRKLVENKANGPAVAQALEGKVTGIVLVEPEGGKVSRAYEASVYFEAGNVWLPELADWLQEYIDEFLAFPQGANDDQVDTTSQSLNHANPGAGNKLSRLAEAVRAGKV